MFSSGELGKQCLGKAILQVVAATTLWLCAPDLLSTFQVLAACYQQGVKCISEALQAAGQRFFLVLFCLYFFLFIFFSKSTILPL